MRVGMVGLARAYGRMSRKQLLIAFREASISTSNGVGPTLVVKPNCLGVGGKIGRPASRHEPSSSICMKIVNTPHRGEFSRLK